MQTMGSMLPSAQLAYMKKLVADGAGALIPPSQEEMKEWKGVYMSYFNSDLSVKKGRMMPKSLCVKNPRPDEITQAIGRLGIRSCFEAVSKHCMQ